jgi:hypothetical protein
MIVGQEVVERTNSRTFFEGQPTKAVLVQTCIGIFFIVPVDDIIFAFILEPSTDRRGQPGEQMRTTV